MFPMKTNAVAQTPEKAGGGHTMKTQKTLNVGLSFLDKSLGSQTNLFCLFIFLYCVRKFGYGFNYSIIHSNNKKKLYNYIYIMNDLQSKMQSSR